MNVIVRARQLLPAGTAIAGAHHTSHLNSGIQAARIVEPCAGRVRANAGSRRKTTAPPLVQPESQYILSSSPAIAGAKDGCGFAANVHGLSVLRHQDACA